MIIYSETFSVQILINSRQTKYEAIIQSAQLNQHCIFIFWSVKLDEVKFVRQESAQAINSQVQGDLSKVLYIKISS